MLAMMGFGFVVGIIAVVGLLRLTMREEPSGCFLVAGVLVFLVMVVLVAVIVGTAWSNPWPYGVLFLLKAPAILMDFG